MNRPQPSFGLTTLTCVVVAGMIGSGVFTTSGYSMQTLGSATRVLIAWSIGGGIAICGAIAYGALARRMPESGGEYLYLTRQLHPFAGFLTGWISLTAGFSGAIALSAVTFEKYVVTDQWRPDWLPDLMVAKYVVIVCGLAHAMRIREAATLQNLVVIVKLSALLLFLTLAAVRSTTTEWHWEPLPNTPDAVDVEGAVDVVGDSNAAKQNESGSEPDFLALCYAMATSVMWISLSYAGFNAAIYIASEVVNPAVTVPRAILIGTILTTGLYLLLNLVFVTAAPAAEISGQPDVAAVAAFALGGSQLALLIRVAIGLATFSSVASMIMTGPRIYARMADDGWLPQYFRSGPQLIPRTVLLQTALALILIQTTTLLQLLSYLGTTLSLSSAITVSTLLFCTQSEPVGIVRRAAAAAYLLATLTFVTLMSIGDFRHLYGTLVTLAVGCVCWKISQTFRSTHSSVGDS